MLNQLDVKTAIGTVLINAVQQDLTGTQLLTRLYQLLGVDVASFAAAFDGALIPSLSMQLRSISPAPSFSQVCTSWIASMSRPSRPPLTVH
jgi:hypothetical protein